MGRMAISALVILLSLNAGSAALANAHHCFSVRASYGVYANNDFLQVSGSKHRLVVVIDALDHKLEKLGWERWVATGDFMICSESAGPPALLTNKDQVSLRRFSNIQFVRR
jgi:hypothetical protein